MLSHISMKSCPMCKDAFPSGYVPKKAFISLRPYATVLAAAKEQLISETEAMGGSDGGGQGAPVHGILLKYRDDLEDASSRATAAARDLATAQDNLARQEQIARELEGHYRVSRLKVKDLEAKLNSQFELNRANLERLRTAEAVADRLRFLDADNAAERYLKECNGSGMASTLKNSLQEFAAGPMVPLDKAFRILGTAGRLVDEALCTQKQKEGLRTQLAIDLASTKRELAETQAELSDERKASSKRARELEALQKAYDEVQAKLKASVGPASASAGSDASSTAAASSLHLRKHGRSEFESGADADDSWHGAQRDEPAGTLVPAPIRAAPADPSEYDDEDEDGDDDMVGDDLFNGQTDSRSAVGAAKPAAPLPATLAPASPSRKTRPIAARPAAPASPSSPRKGKPGIIGSSRWLYAPPVANPVLEPGPTVASKAASSSAQASMGGGTALFVPPKPPALAHDHKSVSAAIAPLPSAKRAKLADLGRDSGPAATSSDGSGVSSAPRGFDGPAKAVMTGSSISKGAGSGMLIQPSLFSAMRPRAEITVSSSAAASGSSSAIPSRDAAGGASSRARRRHADPRFFPDDLAELVGCIGGTSLHRAGRASSFSAAGASQGVAGREAAVALPAPRMRAPAPSQLPAAPAFDYDTQSQALAGTAAASGHGISSGGDPPLASAAGKSLLAAQGYYKPPIDHAGVAARLARAPQQATSGAHPAARPAGLALPGFVSARNAPAGGLPSAGSASYVLRTGGAGAAAAPARLAPASATSSSAAGVPPAVGALGAPIPPRAGGRSVLAPRPGAPASEAEAQTAHFQDVAEAFAEAAAEAVEAAAARERAAAREEARSRQEHCGYIDLSQDSD